MKAVIELTWNEEDGEEARIEDVLARCARRLMEISKVSEHMLDHNGTFEVSDNSVTANCKFSVDD